MEAYEIVKIPVPYSSMCYMHKWLFRQLWYGNFVSHIDFPLRRNRSCRVAFKVSFSPFFSSDESGERPNYEKKSVYEFPFAEYETQLVWPPRSLFASIFTVDNLSS